MAITCFVLLHIARCDGADRKAKVFRTLDEAERYLVGQHGVGAARITIQMTGDQPADYQQALADARGA